MSTRSLTHVHRDGVDSPVIVTIYRQCDGYPSGLGMDLFGILGKSRLVNGLSRGEKTPAFFNGMGCMAAYLVGQLKGNDIGGVYIFEPHASGVMEEYIYDVYKQPGDNGTLMLRVASVYDDKPLYDGTIAYFKVPEEKDDEDMPL
jgi:hypothetical protein